MNGVSNFFRGMSSGMEKFGHTIGSLVNTILLLLVYVIGVGLTSVIAKVFRKKFLEMERQPGNRTYWSNLNLKKKSIDKYLRQF